MLDQAIEKFDLRLVDLLLRFLIEKIRRSNFGNSWVRPSARPLHREGFEATTKSPVISSTPRHAPFPAFLLHAPNSIGSGNHGLIPSLLRIQPVRAQMIFASPPRLGIVHAPLSFSRKTGPRDARVRPQALLLRSEQEQSALVWIASYVQIPILTYEAIEDQRGIAHVRTKNGELEVLLVHPGARFFRKKDNGAWTIPKARWPKAKII